MSIPSINVLIHHDTIYQDIPHSCGAMAIGRQFVIVFSRLLERSAKGGRIMEKLQKSWMVVVAVFLIVVAGISVGCSANNQGQVSAPSVDKGNQVQAPTKVSVGYIAGSLSREFFLETAFEKGIFQKYGLEVQDRGYAVGGLMIQDMANGILDIGLVGTSPSLAGGARGVDLMMVSSVLKNNAPLVARQGLNSLKDLNRKKIGTPGLSSIQETMLNYLERKEGFKALHVYGKPSELVGYFEKGEIDAILAWEPIAAQTVAKFNAHYLLDTVIPGAEAAGVTVSGKLFREHPDVIVRFLKAVEETRQSIIKNKDERIKAAAKKTGLPESVIAESIRRSNLYLDSLELNMDNIRLVASEDIASGKLKGVNQEGLEAFLGKIIDTTLLKKALANNAEQKE